MSQLIKLNLVKRDITSMTGKRVFNVSKMDNIKSVGSNCKFNYREKTDTVPYTVDETYSNISLSIENYDYQVKVEVLVDKWNDVKIDGKRQIDVDRIIYGFKDKKDKSKTVIFYDESDKDQESILKLNEDIDSVMNKANTAAGGGTTLSNIEFTKNLNVGDNTVNHNIGTDHNGTVTAVDVWEGSKHVLCDFEIIDTDNINIVLSGGSISNARIEITYKI